MTDLERELADQDDAEKAFQSFFNDWVTKRTAERLKETPEVPPNEARHKIRDAALIRLSGLIRSIQEDRFEMIRFENPDDGLDA